MLAHKLVPSYGGSSTVQTTPKFAGQTEPAEVVDYSPTRATGLELEHRRQGIFLRPHHALGDDDYPYDALHGDYTSGGVEDGA